jgi:hypothetical protein
MSLHIKTKGLLRLILLLHYESIESKFTNSLLLMLIRIKAARELLRDPIHKLFENSMH